MDRCLLKAFWMCGDNDIIEFALLKARLNKMESRVIRMMLDECMSQEQIAEQMDLSTRKVQQLWYTGADKLLNIPWVHAFANELTQAR